MTLFGPLRVRACPGEQEVVAADPVLAARVGAGRHLRLGFGNRSAEVRVQPGPCGQLLLPRGVVRRLLLPLPEEGRLLRVRHDGALLRVGPLVGVLTWRRRRPPFGADTALIAAMTRLAAEEGILVCAFTPAGVDPRRGCVEAHLFDPVRGRWQRRTLPLPDAVYDRVTSRTVEAARTTRLALRYLERALPGRCFNRGFWDKWDVHRVLARSAEWAPLLPATATYRGGRQLLRWLRRYGEVWLKPRQGTGGLGILIARCLADGSVLVRRARGSGGGVARTAAELQRLVAGLKRPGPYLIQEGLKLARHGGRPFDIRILVQKDGSGTWRRTKVYARVAGPGAVVSNISAGGTGMRVAQAFAAAPPALRRRLSQVRAVLRKVAEGVPRDLERALGGPIGEVGLDLAVDEEGRVRFIEANAKPFRLAATLTGSPERVRLSLLRPVQYAAYLAGFMPASDGSATPCRPDQASA